MAVRAGRGRQVQSRRPLLCGGSLHVACTAPCHPCHPPFSAQSNPPSPPNRPPTRPSLPSPPCPPRVLWSALAHPFNAILLLLAATSLLTKAGGVGCCGGGRSAAAAAATAWLHGSQASCHALIFRAARSALPVLQDRATASIMLAMVTLSTALRFRQARAGPTWFWCTPLSPAAHDLPATRGRPSSTEIQHAMLCHLPHAAPRHAMLTHIPLPRVAPQEMKSTVAASKLAGQVHLKATVIRRSAQSGLPGAAA